MIKVESPGNFEKTREFIARIMKRDIYRDLDRWGRIGADALASATPVATGETASSWSYDVSLRGDPTITWYNDSPAGNTPVVILLQYGHATGTGGYVQGQDFINPAIRPIFDTIADEVWREVNR